MKKTALIFLAILTMTICASAQEIVQINSTKLPAQARTIIRNAWNNAPIVDAWRYKNGRIVEYKASVEDGSIIKFNANGQWIEIKSYGGVPTNLLPKALVKFVNDYHEGQQIVHVTKTTKRYRIELTDGTKLEFNSKGVFQAFL